MELKTYRLQIVLSLICAVLTVIFTLLVPVLTGKAVDCMIGSGQIHWDGLYQILEKMALAIVGTGFFQWLMNRINNYITYDITKNMRQRAFEKMLVMPIKDIDSHSHGDYMSRIATDADVFSDGLLMGFTQLFTGVATIVGTLCFMLSVNVMITFVVVLITPVSFLVANFIAKRSALKSKLSESRYVLILLSKKRSLFQNQVKEKLEEIVEQKGYIAISLAYDLDEDRLAAIRALAGTLDLAGMVAFPDREGVLSGAFFKGLRFPVVLIGNPVDRFAADTLLPDTLVGSYRAVRHLIKNGHERIYYLSAS